MTKHKLTPWFSPNVKPVRAGWYELDWGDKLSNAFDWFDGENWFYGDGEGVRSDCPIRFLSRKWRGILK